METLSGVETLPEELYRKWVANHAPKKLRRLVDSRGEFATPKQLLDEALNKWAFTVMMAGDKEGADTIFEAVNMIDGGRKTPGREELSDLALSMPIKVLGAFPAETSMLSGYVAEDKGDFEEAVYYFELAQSEYLKTEVDDLTGYMLASRRLALSAYMCGMMELSRLASRNADCTDLNFD
jgi:hypothetical protein